MHATTRHLHHHPRRWRRRRMAAAAAAALASTLVAAQSSTATTSRVTAQPTYTTVVTDPNDTDGPFDVARVKHRVLDRQQLRVRYTVETYSPYAALRLDVRNRNFVLELNRNSHPGSERDVRVSYVSGSLVGEVISNATRKTLVTVAVQRIDARTIRFPEPRDLSSARGRTSGRAVPCSTPKPAGSAMVTRSPARTSYRRADGSEWTDPPGQPAHDPMDDGCEKHRPAATR